MSFHPKMFACIHGLEPLSGVRSLALPEMLLDVWNVRGAPGAGGRYVSMHPRFVFLFAGRNMLLHRRGEVADGPCAACYIPAGLDLQGNVTAAGQLRHLDLHLSLERLRRIVPRCVPLDLPVFLPDLSGFDAIAEVLAQECEDPQRSAAHVEALADALLLEVFHRAQRDAPRQAGASLPMDSLRAFVLANLEQRISVETLAARAGLSRTVFNRTFREETGQSPYQWVLQLRIERSKALMAEGHSFATVAANTGFADQAHFTRAFKAAAGVPPGVWTKGPRRMPSGPILQDR
ncbi:helix-turn-helix domain-containing protein [Algicella marina]|uniref:Helix-turn-helix domain-containing protein n=1 Tax=Algicella marina TaxID=2683284 RepID=A0A6P1SZU7_9RHOB|nr:AraC family transcriptional regulator [Algicella marina]QHQ35130.1 helix-turn-helix domain-containing protein [Algicella marina]